MRLVISRGYECAILSPHNGVSACIILPASPSPHVNASHSKRLNSVIIYERDNNFNYFGFKVRAVSLSLLSSLYFFQHDPDNIRDAIPMLDIQTLERSYLLKLEGKGE